MASEVYEVEWTSSYGEMWELKAWDDGVLTFSINGSGPYSLNRTDRSDMTIIIRELSEIFRSIEKIQAV
jgi:hypothetical protein